MAENRSPVSPIDLSVLTETKKVLGIEEEYTVYDTDISMYINAAFSTVHQLRGDKTPPFMMTDKEQTWRDAGITEELMMLKSYVWTSVRLAFDPPTNSFGITSLESLKTQLEWRLNVATDRSTK